MKRNVIILAAAVATVLAGCNQQSKAPGAAAQKSETETAVLTKTTTAVKTQVAQTEEFTTTLLPYKKTFITPQMSLRIDNIFVEVGDKVEENQVVATLDKNQYNQSAVQLKNAKQNLERMQSVYEAGGVSKQQIDELQTSVTVLEETVANLERNIELRSPISGVITGRYNEPGDLFAMGANADGGIGVLQVMQTDRLKATVSLSEQYYPLVYKGMKVSVSADVYPDKEFPATVNLVYPSINPATRTFKVELLIPNKEEILRPGMFSRSEFNFGQKESVVVPDVAVQKQMGVNDRYVYVIKDGKAERRVVELGRQVGSLVEVLSGVEAGEEVAITALSKLRNGIAVTIGQ